MSDEFFNRPILNNPYEYPSRHWELDETGQPTQRVVESRRIADFIIPIPKPKKRRSVDKQEELDLHQINDSGDSNQQYSAAVINGIRSQVDAWRKIPDTRNRGVTPATAHLLEYWRHHEFSNVRPFFCQLEAVETAIWFTEVAPKSSDKKVREWVDVLRRASADANPELSRLALKLATGAGKTTVMAMLIAWQTINAVRMKNSKKFTNGFLIVTPGITIKDRLRVLQPNDPDSYYKTRELIPTEMLREMNEAKIVITNYHAFKLRERVDVSKGTRGALEGWREEKLATLETEGQMLQRVMPELMGMKRIIALNDEAHHCYREKPPEEDDAELTGDDKKEAEKNKEAARLWISGLEAVNRKIGVERVFDLSATPFFLKGSGYAEGTLFPWTMSDFSLMDAIECGIVKLPRVPVADNLISRDEMPMYRNLWEHIRKDMPKKGRRKGGFLDPKELPTPLLTAMDALYGHYKETFELWQDAGVKVPPCFIIVCNNTAASKLVYDFISGYEQENEDGSVTPFNGYFPLFDNYDEHTQKRSRPRTLLIDSEQLESGEALDDNFKKAAADEIDRFRREIIERTGDRNKAEKITDQDLLREAMNTVGRIGQLGESIRCVVSVSMLTEGWDTNTVTHVLGVRAFGTQLLCEQVIGRALRRQSYEINEDNKFNVEYADVLGIPFDFTAKPVVAPPQKPRETINVKAVSPDRDALEIRFPRVGGYRVEWPEERLEAEFNDDSTLILTPQMVGATETTNSGIIGEPINLNLESAGDVRSSQVLYELTSHLVLYKWREPGEAPKMAYFGQLKRVAKKWIENHLVCQGGTKPVQLKYKVLADIACERIIAGITRAHSDTNPIKAVLDPYNQVGSTRHVNFNTSKLTRWETDSRKCHINWAISDSDWELEFCRVVENHPKVRAYVKNHNLGLEVPYQMGSVKRRYIPDFIVQVDDGHEAPLNLIVEIKGYRGEDAKEKKSTMETYWIPGVNNLKTYGRWAFAEFCNVYEIQDDFASTVEAQLNEFLENVATTKSTGAV